MYKATQTRIFDKFYQVDGSHKATQEKMICLENSNQT